MRINRQSNVKITHMEKYLYTCHYCSKSYKPKRRKKQKYCSNSCRTRAFMLRKSKLSLAKPITEGNNVAKNKVEQVSLAGVGNAAIGTLAVNMVSNLFTNEGNKPATKNDIKKLTSKLTNRYHLIKNIPIRNDGAKAYYDFETQTYIYLKN